MSSARQNKRLTLEQAAKFLAVPVVLLQEWTKQGFLIPTFNQDGKPLPGLAPVAKQQGAYVARVLRARLAGKPAPGPFRYRDYGTLATIGRRAAVADFGWVQMKGTLAWLLWGAVHISFLIGFKNRLIVMLDWIWSYLTFQSGARLITGPGSY